MLIQNIIKIAQPMGGGLSGLKLKQFVQEFGLSRQCHNGAQEANPLKPL